MNDELKNQLKDLYNRIYKNSSVTDFLLKGVEETVSQYNISEKPKWLTEADSILITYGDSLTETGKPGLQVLNDFLTNYVGNAVSIVHLLPMFPSSSDDGFSVIDYEKINPSLGTWQDINILKKNYKLMFDAVINHVSKSSNWFKKFLACEKPFDEFFLSCDPADDYSKVIRPRSLPLLTKFKTSNGYKYVWTTFSDDQVDLNYKNPNVYLAILHVLLSFAQKGANLIRLDAIGFIWKKKGTTCMHLPEVHEIVQSYRAILDEYAPGTMLITETNVPHKENISYFGGPNKEAHLVYQFPLPPLVMFSFITGDCSKLSHWASCLDNPKKGTTYFNFLSSHDGIGLRPVEGILTKDEIGSLINQTLRAGGKVSYKDNGDGTTSPYELNINYQDAMALPDDKDSIRIYRFIAAETILLSLQGIPGIYIHSLLGSRNDYYDASISNIPRRINRETLNLETVEKELETDTNRKIIFNELIRRLKIRRQHDAFSPDSAQIIYEDNPHVFMGKRISKEESIMFYVNVSSDEQIIDVYDEQWDILSNNIWNGKLYPYQCVWILNKLSQ